MSAGMITALVFGIASLIIAVIIAFVIVSTLTGADLLTTGRSTITVSNESGYVNATGYTLDEYSTANAITDSFAISQAFNGTDDAEFLIANITLSSGVVTNASSEVWGDALISYTYQVYSTEEYSSSLLSGNFTSGVDNVSAKIPTVLLVAAIVLILGVLVLLVGVWQRMRIGGGSI